jgi:hypothetical protein
MTHAPAEEILPGIILGIYPLPAGGNLDVALVLACGARLAVTDTGVAEFMPGALAPALAACSRTLAQVELIVNIPVRDGPDLEGVRIACWRACRRCSSRRGAGCCMANRSPPPRSWSACLNRTRR